MAAGYAKMEVKKQEYHAVAGASYPDEKRAGNVVASQPAAISGIENYVIDLDASQVAGLFTRFFLHLIYFRMLFNQYI